MSPAAPSISIQSSTSAMSSGSGERLRVALHDAADALAELMMDTFRAAVKGPDDEHALLVDVKASAERLGVSVTALRRFERNGTLPAVRMGRRLLFRPEVLMRFAADHERVRR